MNDLVQTLKDRAESTGGYSACYMACLAGMWGEVTKMAEAPWFNDHKLYHWSMVGYDASQMHADKKKKIAAKKDRELGIISRN